MWCCSYSRAQLLGGDGCGCLDGGVTPARQDVGQHAADDGLLSPRDPGWLVVAYSLLSQVTHATTLGCLHTVRFGDDEIWHGNELSPELMALSLDVTCIASAYLIGHSLLILTELSP